MAKRKRKLGKDNESVGGNPLNEVNSFTIMETYMAFDDGMVTVGEVGMIGDRELVREWLASQFGASHVWFMDEVGTSRDMITGPCPLYGPHSCSRPDLN